MMYNTDTKTLVARKEHQCTYCAEPINKGDTYKRWTTFFNNASHTSKMHPECLQDLIDVYDGFDNEYVPLSNDRPQIGANS